MGLRPKMDGGCEASSSTLLEEDLFLSSDEEVVIPESQVRSPENLSKEVTCHLRKNIINNNTNAHNNQFNSFSIQAKDPRELSQVVEGIANRPRTAGELYDISCHPFKSLSTIVESGESRVAKYAHSSNNVIQSQNRRRKRRYKGNQKDKNAINNNIKVIEVNKGHRQGKKSRREKRENSKNRQRTFVETEDTDLSRRNSEADNRQISLNTSILEQVTTKRGKIMDKETVQKPPTKQKAAQGSKISNMMSVLCKIIVAIVFVYRRWCGSPFDSSGNSNSE